MLFLPGVGAFPKAINSLKKLNLIYAIKKEVKKEKILEFVLECNFFVILALK